MFKANKNHKNLFLAAKLILFLGVLFALYLQLNTVDLKLWDEWHLVSPAWLIVSILLVFPNIYCTYLMWTVTLSTLDIETNRSIRNQSFFAGLVTGMLTPNMIGNFLGRIYYFKSEKRTLITGFTLLTNFAQFATSLAFGFTAIILTGSFYPFEDVDSVIIAISILFVVSIIIYYYGEKLIPKSYRKWRLNEIREELSQTNYYRTLIVALSSIRFVIFTTQFALMLMAFGATLDWEVILTIWKVYLITMMAPSLFLGKLGIKESISLFILTSIGINDFAILFTSLIIWFVNSLSPALLGLIVARRRKFS